MDSLRLSKFGKLVGKVNLIKMSRLVGIKGTIKYIRWLYRQTVSVKIVSMSISMIPERLGAAAAILFNVKENFPRATAASFLSYNKHLFIWP